MTDNFEGYREFINAATFGAFLEAPDVKKNHLTLLYENL